MQSTCKKRVCRKKSFALSDMGVYVQFLFIGGMRT
jgi:hypothetical protein